MKIGINGTGVAGPTLAWWLKHHGHEPVLFEKAPELRTGGYVIDFWGVGYDIAEKMGILPTLKKKGYLMQELRMVDAQGTASAKMSVDAFRAMTNDRYLSIARGDLAATIFEACDGVETHFKKSIVGIVEEEGRVLADLSDGTSESFDLIVGADGLHSHIRHLTFGPESEFERTMGYQVAVFCAHGYRPRDELSYVAYSEPGRQIARIALRDDMTAFLFIWRDDVPESPPHAPHTEAEKKAAISRLFGDMKWETAAILERLQDADSVYLDRVSQIHMPSWSKGRVSLVGDAAACVSLLAGEGTGLGMTEAYVLAGELGRAGSDYRTALSTYEARLHPFLREKQKNAMKFAGFFAPKNRFSIQMRDLSVKVSSVPWLAKVLLAPTLRDNIELPEYEAQQLAS